MKFDMLLVAMVTLCLASAGVHAEFEEPASAPADTNSNAKKDKKFSGYVRTSLGYNDNVQVKPDVSAYDFVGDTESLYVALQVHSSYRFDIGDHITVTPTLHAEKIWYLDDAQTVGIAGNTTDDANDYNILSVSPELAARYHFEIANMQASAGLTYYFRFEEAQIHAAGLKSHNITGDLALALDRHWDVGVSYGFGWDEFQVVFPDATLNERDGKRSALNATVSFKWDQGKRKVMGNVGYMQNNAEGRNFDYHAWNVGVGFQTHLVAGLWGSARLDYKDADYRGFMPALPGGYSRDDQQNISTTLQLVYVIDKHWSVDAFWQYQHMDGGNRAFESAVNNFGVGLTFSF